MYKWHVIALMMGACLIFATGCDAAKSTSSTKRTEKKAAPAQGTTAPAKTQAQPAATSEKSTAPAKPAKELVINGSIEDWKDGKPAGWIVKEKDGDKFKDITLQKGEDAGKGKASMILPKATQADGFVIVKQDFPKTAIVPGKKVTVKGMFKASAPDQVAIVFGYTRDKKGADTRKVHSGSGKWEKLEWSFILPAGVDPASCNLNIYRRGAEEGASMADDISVTIQE
ncbi:MAG TPA: hypothetical protein PLI09_03685 [Candidatus Hydrogenedentes bacterium]|nr:hypothetical protein [Candidatus Hydrogenedentota bacterium]